MHRHNPAVLVYGVLALVPIVFAHHIPQWGNNRGLWGVDLKVIHHLGIGGVQNQIILSLRYLQRTTLFLRASTINHVPHTASKCYRLNHAGSKIESKPHTSEPSVF